MEEDKQKEIGLLTELIEMERKQKEKRKGFFGALARLFLGISGDGRKSEELKQRWSQKSREEIESEIVRRADEINAYGKRHKIEGREEIEIRMGELEDTLKEIEERHREKEKEAKKKKEEEEEKKKIKEEEISEEKSLLAREKSLEKKMIGLEEIAEEITRRKKEIPKKERIPALRKKRKIKLKKGEFVPLKVKGKRKRKKFKAKGTLKEKISQRKKRKIAKRKALPKGKRKTKKPKFSKAFQKMLEKKKKAEIKPLKEMERKEKEIRKELEEKKEEIEEEGEKEEPEIIRKKIKQEIEFEEEMPELIARPLQVIETEISEIRERLKHLQESYLKRRITEDEFRQKNYDYTEKLHMLELEKKRSQKQGIKPAKQPKPETIGDAISRIIMPAPKPKPAPMPRRVFKKMSGETEEDRRKRLSALEEFHKEFSSHDRGGEVSDEEERDREVKEAIKASFRIGAERKPRMEEVDEELKRKAEKAKLNEEKVTELEGKIQDIMTKYDIPEKEMEEDIKKLDATKLLGDFDKLLSLIELEHKTQTIIRKPKDFEHAYIGDVGAIKREEAKTVIKEIKSYRLVTDLDKVLNLVNELGVVRGNEVKRALGLDEDRLKKYCSVLEKNGLIKVEYPAVGDIKITASHYKLTEEMDKSKKALQTKQKKEKVKKDEGKSS